VWRKSSTRGYIAVKTWSKKYANGLRRALVVTRRRRRKLVPKILYIEDDEMNRDMLSRRLERRGYQVILALNGEEGVAIAQSEAPDLILMDLSLPVMNGWEAARRLKGDHQTRSIPIIALTAHAMEGDMQKAIESGCDDYDSKPIDLPQLLVKIEGLLNREK
jgi:CheY-like chemotaxis protein